MVKGFFYHFKILNKVQSFSYPKILLEKNAEMQIDFQANGNQNYHYFAELVYLKGEL